MKAGAFNQAEYLEKLYEQSEENTNKGFGLTNKDGLILPDDTKKNFDWLNKEYQKGKVEVKIEVKGEGSSFKPGYDLQSPTKSVKDFKPGMYGDVKTEETSQKTSSPKTEEPTSPKNKKEENPAEDTDPKNAKESKKEIKETKKSIQPKSQQMKIKVNTKKNDGQ